MSLNCTCPLDPVLPNQIDLVCGVDFDQIVKIGFQKPQASAPFTTIDPITDVDSWVALASASDETKVVFSPPLSNVVIPSSEATYVGENSNESVNGLGFYMGENNVRITGEIVSASQAVADALEELSCYSDTTLGASSLTAYLFTRRIKGTAGVISKDGTVAGDHAGIEIFNFRISSVSSEGYQSKNKYMIAFDVQPDALKGTSLSKISFNPLALANVVTT